MNLLQKAMLTKVAEQMKKQGTPRVLINFELDPDDPLFFTPLKENEILIDRQTSVFLHDFYFSHNKNK